MLKESRLDSEFFCVGEQVSRQIGENIRRYRLGSGLTPKEFADDIAASVSFIARLEAGELQVDVGILDKCARALNLEVSDLVA